MGIDGVGKPGAVGPPAGTPGASGAGPAAESFRSELGGVSAAAPADPSSPLAQLGRGEIGLEQYLDLRVDDAVRHLHGRLDAEQLAFVKESLRQQLETDPVLVELVRRATGSAPADNER